jgi:hypothetical protein
MAYRTDKWEELYQPHAIYEKCNIDFCQLPEKYDVDIDLISEEIAKVLLNHELRGYPRSDGSLFPGYSGICFKSEPGSNDPLYDGLKSNSLLAMRRRHVNIDENFTVKNEEIWFPYLDDIVNKFNGTVTQIRLIKLDAGCNLGEKQHIDYPWYKGIRMHIPLTKGIKYEWRVFHKRYFAEYSPHIYFLDTGKPHDARNRENSVDRYILNVNMIPYTTEIAIHEQIENQIL